jgi:hypothetical protein
MLLTKPEERRTVFVVLHSAKYKACNAISQLSFLNILEKS